MPFIRIQWSARLFWSVTMPRVCHFTGARTQVGNSIKTRGKAKYLGGVGTKVTGITRRTFRPNLQTVNAVIDGVPRRIKVKATCIKKGWIVKPSKRKYTYTRKLNEEG